MKEKREMGDLVFGSTLLGLGLAMDAFSVSLTNGICEPEMKMPRMFIMAGIFGGFQGIMPLIGWACVHSIAKTFEAFRKFIPWIALLLLLYIGGKMLKEGFEEDRSNRENKADPTCKELRCEEGVKLTTAALLLQGIATSIDALSVGFSIAGYGLIMAFTSAVIIGVITLAICFSGIALGKRFGTRLAGKATIFGGIILIIIGIQIWVKGVFL